nr:hypothetical protein Iba_chr03cCG14260 [Ipomoea batatas]
MRFEGWAVFSSSSSAFTGFLLESFAFSPIFNPSNPSTHAPPPRGRSGATSASVLSSFPPAPATTTSSPATSGTPPAGFSVTQLPGPPSTPSVIPTSESGESPVRGHGSSTQLSSASSSDVEMIDRTALAALRNASLMDSGGSAQSSRPASSSLGGRILSSNPSSVASIFEF